MSHEGVIPGHITNPHTTVHHATETQAHIAIDETLHTEDSHHTGVFPGITVNPDHAHHTNKTTRHHQNSLTVPTRQPEKTKTGKINMSLFMTHHPNTTALMNNPANPMRI